MLSVCDQAGEGLKDVDGRSRDGQIAIVGQRPAKAFPLCVSLLSCSAEDSLLERWECWSAAQRSERKQS